MWGFPRRAESDLEVGAGYFDVFSASGNLKELLGKRCQYGLTVTKEKSFVMQGFCKWNLLRICKVYPIFIRLLKLSNILYFIQCYYVIHHKMENF